MIEELEDSVEPEIKKITPSSTKNRYWIPVGAGLVILVTALGFFYFNRTKPVSAQPLKSIAVLPLKSLNNEKDKALSVGFADTLITRLGSVEEIKVLSTNAVSRYADEAQEPLEIGRKLNVDGIIDGTLQKANGKFRVTLRLIRTSDGKQLWNSSFDESESEIFRLQDLMAVETAQALAMSLTDKAE